jgi:Cu/Ag efflux pump CusA
VRSQSIQGLSVIDITFREGSDPYRARQQVAEALADAAALPAGAASPHITPLTSSTMDLLKVGLVSDRLPDATARTGRMDHAPAPAGRAWGGARNVFGGDERRIEVRERPEALLARGLTLADLAGAVQRGGGQRRRLCRHAQPAHPDRPRRQRHRCEGDADAVLARGNGGTVRIGDVADVAMPPRPALAMR